MVTVLFCSVLYFGVPVAVFKELLIGFFFRHPAAFLRIGGEHHGRIGPVIALPLQLDLVFLHQIRKNGHQTGVKLLASLLPQDPDSLPGGALRPCRNGRR